MKAKSLSVLLLSLCALPACNKAAENNASDANKAAPIAVKSDSSQTVAQPGAKPVNGNYFIDARDKHAYGYVKLGNHTWMADAVMLKTSTSHNPNNQEERALREGRLYNWQEAQTICPEGWRLPKLAEFEELIRENCVIADEDGLYAGCKDKLAAKGLQLYNTGFFNDYEQGYYESADEFSFYWTSDEINEGHASVLTVIHNDAHLSQSAKLLGNPVICVKKD